MPIVTTKEMFQKAYAGGYAVGAFNVNNMEIIQGITEAAGELKAPVILQVSKGARSYANHTYLVKLVEAAAKENDIPIALHLDHGDSFELCKSCIDGGFTSVMIDASSKPFAENIELTRKVVEYAHDHGAVVEAELGTLAGVEDDVVVEHGAEMFTRPEEVEEFVSKTGCDSLAIAIGTSHGAYKFKPGTKPQLRFDVLEECAKRLPGFPIVLHGASSVPQNFVEEINKFGGDMPGAIGTSHGAYKFTAAQCTRNEKGELVPPPLRFDILDEISKNLPGFPIVLHGSSSVPQNYVKMINENGGKMPDAVGIPEEQLRQAARGAVCKINIDSDLRLAMTGTIRKYYAEHPDHFDPRQYLSPARANIKKLVKHKLINVLGCDGKA